ncbi:T9SS type A sorting domain-containing protein [Pseudopedobacter beijingensis]|uniref:T9SS type A sorting domain-containing protein n=1 Tax=Pseudopedobacter beijingensis TaxID=1207056 RepID=A0ABW4IJC9_9SPHI
MKRTLLLLGFALFAKLCAAQNFTEGNLVLYRLGHTDGSSPINTTTSSVPIYLEEYSISGTTLTWKQDIALPTTTISGNKRIVAVGNATVEGKMTRSADGRFLVVPGYDQALGADANNSAAATVNRVVALVDYQKNINTTTSLNNPNDGNSFRAATSYDGTNVWTAGGGTGSVTGGVWTASSGVVTATRLGGASYHQLRVFKENLYVAAGDQIYQITGMPTSATPTPTFTNRSGTSSGANRQAFTMVEVGTTGVVYVLKYGSGAFEVEKFSMNYPTNDGWTARGSYVCPVSSYGTAIEARIVNNKVELFVVSSAASTVTAQAKLYKITDAAGATSNISIEETSPTLLKTWDNTYNIRGIAWAPVKNSVLPVKLTDFKATHIGSAVQLSWTTASEKDNDYFEVLKSTGDSFKLVDKVKGNGTTDQISNYNYTDKELSSGTVYYQLRQIDKNGQVELSSVLSVKPARLAAESKIQVQASLSAQQVTVNFNSSTAGQAQLTIRDISGKLITTKAIVVGVGENSFTIPVTLSQAVYLTVISKSGKTQTVKFIPNK